MATAAEDCLSTTIWSGGAAAGLYLGSGLILAFLVHTHYPGVLGLREWIRVVLSWTRFAAASCTTMKSHAEAAEYWRQYLANDALSEWAARARRSLKFCEMQIHLSAC